MVAEKYGVRLSSEDRDQLDEVEHTSASRRCTVFRTKRRYAEEGLDGVLHDHPQANRYRKLDDQPDWVHGWTAHAYRCPETVAQKNTLKPWRKPMVH